MKQIYFILIYLCYNVECILDLNNLDIKKLSPYEFNSHCLIKTNMKMHEVDCFKCKVKNINGSKNLTTDGLQSLGIYIDLSNTLVRIPLIIDCNTNVRSYSNEFSAESTSTSIEIIFKSTIKYGFIIVYTDGKQYFDKIIKQGSNKQQLTIKTKIKARKVCIALIMANGEGFKYKCNKVKDALREKYLFQDCLDSNSKYTGIRSASKNGNKCSKWSDGRNTANWCSSTQKNETPWCHIEKIKVTCDIPKCEKVENSTEKISISSTGSSIEVTWSTKDATGVGYLLLLHNQKGYCIGNVLYSKVDIMDLGIRIRNFYISCGDLRLKSFDGFDFKYHFTGLNNNTLYYVYIIPIIDDNSAGYVTKLQKKTKFHKIIFEDCILDDGTYFGLRKCFSEKTCKISKCENVGQHVANLSMSSIGSSITLKWPYQQNVWIGYLLLLHHENSKCISGIVLSKHQKLKNAPLVRNFYSICAKIHFQKISKVNLKYVFTGLKPDTVYIIHMIPFADFKTPSFVTKLQKKTKKYVTVFEDCKLDNGGYYGIRSYTKSGKTCISWSKTPYKVKSNWCADPSGSGQPWCQGNEFKEECNLQNCKNKEGQFVKSISIQTFTNSILVTWLHQNRNWFGYILLLHDSKGNCEKSVAFQNVEITSVDTHIRSYFGSCNSSYRLPLDNSTFKYRFIELLPETDYEFYIAPIVKKNQIGLLRYFSQRTKKHNLENLFEDCRSNDNSYHGLRSANKYGKVCDNWFFYKKYSDFKLKSNWCANPDFSDSPWCFTNKMRVSCDVPKCEYQEKYFTGINTQLTSSSIAVNWKYDFNVKSFLILLHNENGECVKVILTENKLIKHGIRVLNLYLSCNKIKVFPSNTYLPTYKFTDLTEKVYTLYIIPIINGNKVGLVSIVENIKLPENLVPTIIFIVITLLIILVFIGIVSLRRIKLNKKVQGQSKISVSSEPVKKQDPRVLAHTIPIRELGSIIAINAKVSNIFLKSEFYDLNLETEKLIVRFGLKDKYIRILDHLESDAARNKRLELKTELNVTKIPSIDNKKEIEYMTCEAPTLKTIDNFIQLIWTNDIEFMIMISHVNEIDDSKYMRYFPDSGVNDIEFTNTFVMTLTTESTKKSYIERELDLTNKTTNTTKTIFHYHMNLWDENSVPEFEDLDEILTKVHNLEKKNSAPILVHCSNGLGRTGTFLTIDRISRTVNNGANHINIFNTVIDLRLCGSHVVTTVEQYMFIYLYLNHVINNLLKRNKR